MKDSSQQEQLQILVVSDLRQACYFSAIIANKNTFLYCESSELLRILHRFIPASKFLSSDEIKIKYSTGELDFYTALVPIDQSDAISVYLNNEAFLTIRSAGIAASVVDPESLVIVDPSGAFAKLKDIVDRFECVITPDNDENLFLGGVTLLPSGTYLEQLPSLCEEREGVLVAPDFEGFDEGDADNWMRDVSESLSKTATKYKSVVYKDVFSEDFGSKFSEFLDEIAKTKVLITTRSFVYYIARAIGVQAVLYDSRAFVSTTFCRDYLGGAAYFRYKRDLSKVSELVTNPKNSQYTIKNFEAGFSIAQIENSKKTLLPVQSKHPEHIVIWGRMPPYSYSGGRYHGWLLAEGISALGYRVTVFTDNCPYFINDFTHLPGHRNISLITTNNFQDKTQFPEYGASAVIVIPGMDRSGELYRGAIEYTRLCNAKLGLINFESPNWFNSLVSPPRDERLWKYWEVISRFSSLILSTTEISTNYAKNFYLDAHQNTKFENLYAPINSRHSDELVSIERKEKRVVVFFPRHGYSAHKGWEQIVDCIGPDFGRHTIVFLCGESDLPEEVLNQLDELSQQYKFQIEYKIKIDDREKFEELSRACLLIFPSQFEGYGYPPLEALAVGTPCVAFDLPVLRETCGEHLLYAPIGDFDVFKHLCNKALKDQFRVSKEAVARANDVAHFDSFQARLLPILNDLLDSDSVWDVSPSEKNGANNIEKAFFDEEGFVKNTLKNLPKSVTAKAIVKEQRTIIQETALENTRLCSGPRILLLIKNTKSISTELGENVVKSYLKFAALKGFVVDIVSEDFALETLGESFIFTGGKYISLGGVKLNEYRADANLIIFKMLKQYNYREIISVDGYLETEMQSLVNHPRCPVFSALSQDVEALILSENGFSKVLHSEFLGYEGNDKLVKVPVYLYPKMDRKSWLVTGHNFRVVTYAEGPSDELNEFLAGIEMLRASLGQNKLKLNVSIISPTPLSNLPYYVKCQRVNTNQQIYSFLKQNTVYVDLAADKSLLNKYVNQMAQLIGACLVAIDSKNKHGWREKTIELLNDADSWKVCRREKFNEVLNEISSKDYLDNIYPSATGKLFSFNEFLEKEKADLLNSEHLNIQNLKQQLNDVLDKGCLDSAVETAKRLCLVSQNVAAQVLAFELGLLNRDFELCKDIYQKLRRTYPFEGSVLILATRVNKAMNNLSLACQSAYYGLMLGTTDIKLVLNASTSSLKGGRDLDIEIHKIMAKFFGDELAPLDSSTMVSKREQFLINSLIREHDENGIN